MAAMQSPCGCAPPMDGCCFSPELSDGPSILEELLMLLMMLMGNGGGGGFSQQGGGFEQQWGVGYQAQGHHGGGGFAPPVDFSQGGGGRSLSDPQASGAWDVASSQGGLKFKAGMMIDTDGTGNSYGDRYHQNQTSTRLANGNSLNADITPYIVLPPQLARQYGVKPGDLALVRRGDKVSPAIFGDVGPRNKLGEGSTRLARNLGINSDPNRGGVESGVSYQVFPGSGRGVRLTNENTTTDALWERVRGLQGS